MPILPINPRLPRLPIMPIPLIGNCPVRAIFLLPILPCPVHFLLDPPAFDKVTFLPLYQPTDEHIALVNQRNGEVCNNLIRAVLNLLTIYSRVQMTFAEHPCLNATRVIIVPLLQSTHAKSYPQQRQKKPKKRATYRKFPYICRPKIP